jgi:uncharacterized membrane protein
MFTSLKRREAKKPLRERTKLRIGVASVGLVLSGLLAAHALNTGEEDVGAVCLHLAAVFAEVAITFAVVDALFERNRERDSARRLAVSALNRIHHHVWVWQGGHRALSLPQISGALASVMKEHESHNPLAPYTQTLFLRLGSDAADSLRHEAEVIERNEHLQRAFERLSTLAGIRDGISPMSSADIARFARAAALDLAIALGLPMPIVDQEIARDSDIKAQEWRHFGTRREPEAA